MDSVQILFNNFYFKITYLFLGINTGVDILKSRSKGQLPNCCVKLSYEAVVAVLVVVEALQLDVPVQVTIAQGSNRDNKCQPDLQYFGAMIFLTLELSIDSKSYTYLVIKVICPNEIPFYLMLVELNNTLNKRVLFKSLDRK